jgi:hypothetical protein
MYFSGCNMVAYGTMLLVLQRGANIVTVLFNVSSIKCSHIMYYETREWVAEDISRGNHKCLQNFGKQF